MNDLAMIAIFAAVGGFIGAVLVDLRFWLSFADEVRRHGLDNHSCRKVGCCR